MPIASNLPKGTFTILLPMSVTDSSLFAIGNFVNTSFSMITEENVSGVITNSQFKVVDIVANNLHIDIDIFRDNYLIN